MRRPIRRAPPGRRRRLGRLRPRRPQDAGEPGPRGRRPTPRRRRQRRVDDITEDGRYEFVPVDAGPVHARGRPPDGFQPTLGDVGSTTPSTPMPTRAPRRRSGRTTVRVAVRAMLWHRGRLRRRPDRYLRRPAGTGDHGWRRRRPTAPVSEAPATTQPTTTTVVPAPEPTAPTTTIPQPTEPATAAPPPTEATTSTTTPAG